MPCVVAKRRLEQQAGQGSRLGCSMASSQTAFLSDGDPAGVGVGG